VNTDIKLQQMNNELLQATHFAGGKLGEATKLQQRTYMYIVQAFALVVVCGSEAVKILLHAP
jgi:hypothetical protein